VTPEHLSIPHFPARSPAFGSLKGTHGCIDRKYDCDALATRG
jgi:hypothetical protein